MKSRICVAFGALALVAAASVSESKAGPFGLLGGGRGMICNVRAEVEGPKLAKAENLVERPADKLAVLAPSRAAVEQPVLIAKTKSGVRAADLAKLNAAPSGSATANVAAK